jgi:hypothetical protein
LLDCRRLFLHCKTSSNSTTSSGHLPTSIAPHKNAGLYWLPAFGAADRVTAGSDAGTADSGRERAMLMARAQAGDREAKWDITPFP